MVESILESWPVGVLSTFGARGIDSVPIVFVPVDGMIYSPIDGKPKSGRKLARVRNIERDPRYTLLLQHYDDDWTRLWWLKVSGAACVADTNGQDAVFEALARKYAQYRDRALLETCSQLIRLEPERHVAWAWQGEEWLARQFP